MDIAAFSSINAQYGVRQQAAIQVAVKAMDVSKQQNADLLRLMQASLANSVNPHIGGNIDVRL